VTYAGRPLSRTNDSARLQTASARHDTIRQTRHDRHGAMSSTNVPRVVPAQLSFLAVYNPALGDSDETFHRQIVFYYAKAARARAKLGHASAQQDEALREEENEKLRQVGLAQGMVGFARSFSNGESVDSIDTEKSRIVLHELEHGWWILAVCRAPRRMRHEQGRGG
jgi:hypothetical protein